MATAKKTTGAGDALETLNINPEAIREGYEKLANSMTSFADFQRETLEVFMSSAGSFAKSVEKAATDNATYFKGFYDDGIAAAKAAATSKSVQEAIDIQNEYVRAAFEKNLGQVSKLADHWFSTTKEAADPLADRYGKFVELVQSYRP